MKALLRTQLLLSLLWVICAPVAAVQASGPQPGLESTLILADPADAYYPLAEEIARSEQIPIVHTLDELAEQDPVYLLWVVSPAHLSDQILVEFGLAMEQRELAISTGIISGVILEDARDLWLRAAEVKGQRIFAVNAKNPAGHIEPEIRALAGPEITSQSFDSAQDTPLTRENLVQSLQKADYLTFTGHGGSTHLRLAEGVKLESGQIPDLPPVVVATGSCNTFRLWQAGAIPLAFTGKGAAAYAGFAYSPNEGYLIGEFRGVPFRYTWPEYPIGHVVQVQNHGTLQGFAQLPYYYLLGDPRIALQAGAPYDLVADRTSGQPFDSAQGRPFDSTQGRPFDSAQGRRRTLHFAGAPQGLIPVRIPGGAEYSFVEIPGVTSAGDRDPFYNKRLQMANIGEDKFVLFAHPGGDFTLRLRSSTPWAWRAADLLTDALDHTLLFLQQAGLALAMTLAGGMALVGITFLLWRKKASVRWLVPAALTGLGFAALHGLYAVARLEKLTITSKTVLFSPLSLSGTFLLVSCGAFVFLSTQSWWGRALGVLLATLGALAPGILITGMLAVLNYGFIRPEAGTGLWNYALGLQALVAFAFEGVLIGLVFLVVNKLVKSGIKETVQP